VPEDSSRLRRHLTVLVDRLSKGAQLVAPPPATGLAAAAGEE
jgi:hypothetical protein